MVIVTLQRDKCIGCNYCVEMAPEQFQMSIEKKGFFTIKSHDDSIFEACENAQKACPVKIITTKKI